MRDQDARLNHPAVILVKALLELPHNGDALFVGKACRVKGLVKRTRKLLESSQRTALFTTVRFVQSVSPRLVLMRGGSVLFGERGLVRVIVNLLRNLFKR